MKIFLKVLWILIRIVLTLGILLFSVATLAGGSYIQTFLLWLSAVLIFFWPAFVREKVKGLLSAALRPGLIAVLLAVSFLAFRPEPKTSIYLEESYRKELMEIYEMHMEAWPGDTEDIYVETEFGTVHVLACGDRELPPLVMIHAASMGAHSWVENLEPLLGKYRIYSIDNMGEGNMSELKDVLVFPGNREEIASHLAAVLDELGVENSPVLGASNGGFIAMSYALYYPERVEALLLFGPMGLTPLSGGSVMMLSISTMYPFQFIRDRVTRWALGDSRAVLDGYGDWFGVILKGTVPSVAMPQALSEEERKGMDCPVLLYLGTEDAIVGDVGRAATLAGDFPDIRIEVLESGHLVAVEHAETVNRGIEEFLSTSGVH